MFTVCISQADKLLRSAHPDHTRDHEKNKDIDFIILDGAAGILCDKDAIALNIYAAAQRMMEESTAIVRPSVGVVPDAVFAPATPLQVAHGQ